MKNAKIIVVLALLTLFLSGCANVDRSEVSAPSSQEMVAIEHAQSTVPQESIAVSVSESTEIPAENTANFVVLPLDFGNSSFDSHSAVTDNSYSVCRSFNIG